MARLEPGLYTDRRILAIDSLKHLREWHKNGKHHEFRGIMSVGVETDDINQFDLTYQDILKRIFNRFEVKKERRIYSAHHIFELFHGEPRKAIAFISSFAESILSLDTMKFYFPFVYIHTPSLSYPTIRCYTEYGDAAEDVHVPEFINRIWPWCDVIAAWKIIDRTEGPNNPIVLLDGLQRIQDSYAWRKLTQKSLPQIIYAGDTINPLISSADLLVRAMNEILHGMRLKLHEKGLAVAIERLGGSLEKNCEIIYIGNPDIGAIRPKLKQPIPFSRLKPFIKHPIIFIAKAAIPGLREQIEDYPLYQRLLDHAYSIDGSIKHYDPHVDKKIIGVTDTTDYFVPLSNEADEILETFLRLGANVERLLPADLKTV